MALITTTVDVGTGVTSTGDVLITPGRTSSPAAGRSPTRSQPMVAWRSLQTGGVEIGTIVANGAVSEVAVNGTAIGTIVGCGWH